MIPSPIPLRAGILNGPHGSTACSASAAVQRQQLAENIVVGVGKGEISPHLSVRREKALTTFLKVGL